jgi:predicted PurR-regulated permease PerM
VPSRIDVTSEIRYALWVIAVVAVLFLLHTAKALFIPIVVSAVISYALAPIVAWLEHRRIPPVAGAALVLLAVLAAVASGAYALRDDARALVASLPETVDRVQTLVATQIGSGAHTREPVATSQLTGTFVQQGVGAFLAFGGHLMVVFFLVYFLLISNHLVRDRLVEISGPEAAQRRTTATIIKDINQQIQRYLLVLLVTGVIVAAATWLALAWLDVEHAAIWAILAGVFNSIPYFGPVVVSGGLLVVGLVQGGGSTQALQMSGAAIIITSLEGWLLTPALMGKAERMSAVAVFLGLLLWTWVWGAWGTVLAVPMLVVMKSIADHVDRLRPLGRLMAP